MTEKEKVLTLKLRIAEKDAEGWRNLFVILMRLYFPQEVRHG